eukprot:12380990-Karenia_brevis.AAC.1
MASSTPGSTFCTSPLRVEPVGLHSLWHSPQQYAQTEVQDCKLPGRQSIRCAACASALQNNFIRHGITGQSSMEDVEMG